MKQGQAISNKSAGTKVEPKSHAVSVDAVANTGVILVKGGNVPLYKGRGLQAPMVGTTQHPCGSQGKHK